MSKAIDKAFGLESKEEKVLAKVVYKDGDSNDDFKYARDNYYNIIQRAQEGLEDILSVAQQSESPRAYEVFANLVNTIANANKELVKMAQDKEKLEMEKTKPQEQTNLNVNNAVFCGSTADLQKMIEDSKKKSNGKQ